MLNEEVARIFENMARVLAFKGQDRFRIMAYERDAVSLRDLDQDLATISEAGNLKDIPGAGHDLAEMIEEYVKTRTLRRYERESRGIPEGLIELMAIPVLGPKTLALLHKRCRVNNFKSLKQAIDKGTLARLRGFGEKKIQSLQRGIELWLCSKKRMLLGVALPLADDLLETLRKIRLVQRADVAGSIRRQQETIGDMDVLIISYDSPRALQQALKIPIVKQVLALGDTRATVMIEGGIQVDIRAVPEDSYGAALQYFTGSKQHNVHLRLLGRERGLKINEYGVFAGTSASAARMKKKSTAFSTCR